VNERPPTNGVALRRRISGSKVSTPEVPVAGLVATRASRLLAGSRAVVTLVLAPPGAGKTLALTHWIWSTPGLSDRVAWATLDQGDDDVASLWETLLAALRTNPTVASDPRIAELSAAFGADETLIAELGAIIGRRDQPVVLVLDDLHKVTDPEALASLDLLLRLRPPGLSLVLSARYRPELALHELRLDGSLLELGPADFALSVEESRAVLAYLGFDLDADTVEMLWQRTEGWMAGLRLAAIELGRGGDPLALARTFGGTTPTVAELLVAEVLDQLPAELREFLLATGGCRELTPTLAERLTGRHDAGAVLDDLHQRNALTHRLMQGDPAEPVYRYHDLLRDFLGSELRRTDLARWRQLQGVLSEWYGTSRDWRLALEHAVGSADITQVRVVLRQAGIGLVLDGSGPVIERLLDQVPEAWRTDPVIGSSLAAAALARYDPVATDRHLAARDAAPMTDEDRPADPWVDALGATIDLHRSRFGPEVAEALHLAEAAGVGDTGDVDLDLLGLIQTGVTRIRVGALERSQRDLQDALRLATSTGRDFPAVMCLGNLAALATINGRLPDFDRFREQALRIARLRGWYGSQLTAQLHVLGAWWALLRDDGDAIRREIEALPETTTTVGNPDMRVGAAALRALADGLDGDSPRDVAVGLRMAWEQLADAQTSPALACMLIPWEVKLWLAADDLVAAQEAARRREGDLEGSAEQVFIEAMLARASGVPASKVRRGLVATHEGDRPARFAAMRIWLSLADAQLAAEAGAQQASFDALTHAVRLAAPDRLVGLVAAAGPGTSALLAANRGRFGRHEGFVDAVLERAPAEVGSAGAEALSPTEREILRELPTHHSVAEIAALRGVSVNTVKTHLKGIYRKLGATGRRQAVDAARAQGLL